MAASCGRTPSARVRKTLLLYPPLSSTGIGLPDLPAFALPLAVSGTTVLPRGNGRKRAGWLGNQGADVWGRRGGGGDPNIHIFRAAYPGYEICRSKNMHRVRGIPVLQDEDPYVPPPVGRWLPEDYMVITDSQQRKSLSILWTMNRALKLRELQRAWAFPPDTFRSSGATNLMHLTSTSRQEGKL